MGEKRDCMNCIRYVPNSGCSAWKCDFINRKEAIELFIKAREAEKGEQK